MAVSNHNIIINPGRHEQWKQLDLADLLESAALLVIDATNSVLHPEGAQNGDSLGRRATSAGGSLEKILHLVERARKRSVPVAWLRYEYLRKHYPATALDAAQYEYWYRNQQWSEDRASWDGALTDEVAAIRRDGDLEVKYTSFGNVFIGSPLLPALNAWRVRALIICGYHLDHCVEQAARTARDYGYIPVVVSDCCGASDVADEEPALKRIDSNWAPVVSLLDILTAWR